MSATIAAVSTCISRPRTRRWDLPTSRVSAGAALLSRSRAPGRTGLPQGFHQRIFTVRKRNGEKEKIGGHAPPHVYPLLLAGEKTWEDTGLGGKDRFGRANFDQGDSVLLTAPRLPLPTEARFDFDGTVTAPGENSASGVYQVRDTLDPIDAAIGVSNGGWKEKDSGHAVAQQVDTALAYRYGATRAAWRGR